MRDLKNKLTSSKNTKNIQSKRGKSFGYQVLGFGAGGAGENFIAATGGNTIIDSGDFRIHAFTGPGTFAVSGLADCSANDVVDYLIVAGGGSSRLVTGSSNGGGGGGGLRVFSSSPGSNTPLIAPAGVTVSVQSYSIAVGAGGASPPSIPSGGTGNRGSDSTALGLTSTGGGATGNVGVGQPGGSGGGGSNGPSGTTGYNGGDGNTPPVTPPQGRSGGKGFDGISASSNGGGGGGASAVGTNAACSVGGVGGDGTYIADAFIGPTAPSYGTPGPVSSTRYFAGGGGGASDGPRGAGGAGGGGQGNESVGSPTAVAGLVNTGGGAGATSSGGGSGVVLIRYKIKQIKIMAHFAKISETNEVLTVLTLNNLDMLNAEGVENETVGQAYLEQHNNWPSNLWIQTSYNTVKGVHNNGGIAFRGNYAGIGYTWDEDNQIFWPIKPYASWVKHNASATWKSPIGDAPELTAEQELQNTAYTHRWSYFWNESNTTWDLTDSKA